MVSLFRMSSHKVVAEYKSLLRSVIQGFGLVSLGLERILDSFVPKTVSVRRLDLDHFKVFVVSLGLGQILGSNVLKTVGVVWFILDWFRVCVVSLGLGQILGNNVLKTVSAGWLNLG